MRSREIALFPHRIRRTQRPAALSDHPQPQRPLGRALYAVDAIAYGDHMRARAIAGLVAAFSHGCGGTTPLVLNPDEPQHPCAQSGVSACKQACKRKDDGQACLVTSVAYAYGLEVEKDYDLMVSYELRSCELGVGQGCEYYANNFVGNEQYSSVAAEYYEKSCDAGWTRGCMRLGSLFLRRDAGGKPTDPGAALEHYRKACSKGISRSCSALGDLQTLGIATDMDPTAGKSSYAKACNDDDVNGCHNAEDDGELWLTIPLGTVFEGVHMPDPFFRAANAPPGWHTAIKTRLCVARSSPEPTRVEIVESSGYSEIDALVLDTLQSWRVRARPSMTSELSLCINASFSFRSEK